jgi:hypothetical protein
VRLNLGAVSNEKQAVPDDTVSPNMKHIKSADAGGRQDLRGISCAV